MENFNFIDLHRFSWLGKPYINKKTTGKRPPFITGGGLRGHVFFIFILDAKIPKFTFVKFE